MTYIPIPGLQAEVLPATGAYVTDATPVPIQGYWKESHEGSPSITFRVTYTAGGSGGYPVMRCVWRVINESGTEVDMIDTFTLVNEDEDIETRLAPNELTALTNGSNTSIAVPWIVARDAAKVRVEVAELGNTGAPGTITVAMLGAV